MFFIYPELMLVIKTSDFRFWKDKNKKKTLKSKFEYFIKV